MYRIIVSESREMIKCWLPYPRKISSFVNAASSAVRRCKILRIVRAASAIFADRRKMLTRAEESF